MADTIWNGTVASYHFVMEHLVIINILLSLVIIFFQRRSPQTVWTWLLILYFIPILGFVLYLMIGQDYHKSRMFKAKEIEGELKYAVRRQEEKIYRKRLCMANPEMRQYENLILYNLEVSQAVLTDNNDVRIYRHGSIARRRLPSFPARRLCCPPPHSLLQAAIPCSHPGRNTPNRHSDP